MSAAWWQAVGSSTMLSSGVRLPCRIPQQGGWDVQPCHSGACSLLSRGNRSVFTQEMMDLPLSSKASEL